MTRCAAKREIVFWKIGVRVGFLVYKKMKFQSIMINVVVVYVLCIELHVGSLVCL